LAEPLSKDPTWAGIVTQPFLEALDRCVPLHDIGKIGLPDAVLSKPGLLDETERALVQNHTLIGVTILEALAQEYGESLGFLSLAIQVVRHHHERYDGAGYPDGLQGDSIPPAARIVALADVYDALRRRRFHKPPFTHEQAVKYILNESESQFDPRLQAAFNDCHDRFQKIYSQIRD
jgi:response regulator RpfG family c-di-GMP phosphodiesterase